MKKLFIFILSFLVIILSYNPVYALENNSLEQYTILLEEINLRYNTQFHIYNEKEYYKNSLDQLWNKTYSEYIQEILNTDKKNIEETLLNIIEIPDTINVKVDDAYGRSTQATKTLFFNNNYNKMTLTYKYTSSGSTKYFDTSYKPSVTVTKVAVNNYFQMSSYTGSFKNSNKTYSVIANGKIITYYGTSNKSFTVNFNI